MTLRELQKRRIEVWRLSPGLAPNNEKEIREFLKKAGFCYTYHVQKNLLPSLIQTIKGSTELEGSFSYTNDDPFHEILSETFRIYERHKLFIEVNCFGKHPVIVYRDVFIRLYRLLCTPIRTRFSGVRRRPTRLEDSILKHINDSGGATRRELRMTFLQRKKTDARRLTRTIEALGRDLRIVRGRRTRNDEIYWMTPRQWFDKLDDLAGDLHGEESLEYIILRFLNTSIATSRRSIRNFFKTSFPPVTIDFVLNSLIQRGLITVDPNLVIDGKRALKPRQQ